MVTKFYIIYIQNLLKVYLNVELGLAFLKKVNIRQ